MWNFVGTPELISHGKETDISAVFQELYDLEINYGVSCFWDGGFDVWLGDDMNGILEECNVDKWHEVGPWLLSMAIKHYPGCASELTRVRDKAA